MQVYSIRDPAWPLTPSNWKLKIGGYPLPEQGPGKPGPEGNGFVFHNVGTHWYLVAVAKRQCYLGTVRCVYDHMSENTDPYYGGVDIYVWSALAAVKNPFLAVPKWQGSFVQSPGPYSAPAPQIVINVTSAEIRAGLFIEATAGAMGGTIPNGFAIRTFPWMVKCYEESGLFHPYIFIDPA